MALPADGRALYALYVAASLANGVEAPSWEETVEIGDAPAWGAMAEQLREEAD